MPAGAVVRMHLLRPMSDRDGIQGKEAAMQSDQKQEIRVHIRWMIRRDMPEVLDIERSLFNAELSESQTLRLYINSVIELYKALGGGWTPDEG